MVPRFGEAISELVDLGRLSLSSHLRRHSRHSAEIKVTHYRFPAIVPPEYNRGMKNPTNATCLTCGATPYPGEAKCHFCGEALDCSPNVTQQRWWSRTSRWLAAHPNVRLMIIAAVLMLLPTVFPFLFLHLFVFLRLFPLTRQLVIQVGGVAVIIFVVVSVAFEGVGVWMMVFAFYRAKAEYLRPKY
jgi:hypothetical protein